MGKTQKNLLLQNICNRRFFDTYGCIEENSWVQTASPHSRHTTD